MWKNQYKKLKKIARPPNNIETIQNAASRYKNHVKEEEHRFRHHDSNVQPVENNDPGFNPC